MTSHDEVGHGKSGQSEVLQELVVLFSFVSVLHICELVTVTGFLMSGRHFCNGKSPLR